MPRWTPAGSPGPSRSGGGTGPHWSLRIGRDSDTPPPEPLPVPEEADRPDRRPLGGSHIRRCPGALLPVLVFRAFGPEDVLAAHAYSKTFEECVRGPG